MINRKHILLIALVRALNTFSIITFEHPDECYQSQEIAHADIFGRGYRSWEWTTSNPIRGPLYILLFYPPYLICKLLDIQNPNIVALAPRILQVCILTLFDVFFIKWATKKSGIGSVNLWMIMLYTTQFSIDSFARTYINTTEAAFFMISLYFWEKGDDYENVSLFFIGLNFTLRITSVAIWPWFGLARFWKSRNKLRMIIKYLISFAIMVGASIIVDSLYHKRFTCSFVNFVRFNFLSNKADIFGVQHFTWYLDTAIPRMDGYWLIFAILGLWLLKKNIMIDLMANASEILLLSTVGHKEVRFLAKQLPFLILLSGVGVWRCWQIVKKRNLYKLLFLALFSIICSYHVLGAYKDLRVHWRGSVEVMEYIRNQEDIKAVGMIGPFLGHPGISFLHRQVALIFSLDSMKYPLQSLEYFIRESQRYILIYQPSLSQEVLQVLEGNGYKSVIKTDWTLFAR